MLLFCNLNSNSLSKELRVSTQFKCICDLIKLGKYNWQGSSHPVLLYCYGKESYLKVSARLNSFVHICGGNYFSVGLVQVALVYWGHEEHKNKKVRKDLCQFKQNSVF